MKYARIAAAASALCCLLALGAPRANAADAIPYPYAGNYNDAVYTFTATSSGDIVAYLVGGHDAGYSNELGLLINGVLSPAGYGLENHSDYGTSFNLGYANAGDVLVFVLHNLDPLGMNAYSDPSMNVGYDLPGIDTHNHVYSTEYTATDPVFVYGSVVVPAGTYVGFEDLQFPDSNYNYDDESFVFTNVRVGTGVPEPGVLALFVAAGVPLSAFAIRRRAR